MLKILNSSLILYGVFIMSELINNELLGFMNIPSSILGMVIMFLLLETKIVKVKNFEVLSKFFLENMSFFFIPLGVGLMKSLDIIDDVWVYLIIILALSNITVMYISGKTVDLMMKRKMVK